MSKSKDKSKKDSSKKSKSRSEAPQENDAVQSPAADVEVPVEAEVAPKKEKKRKRDKNTEDDVAETPKKAKKSAEVLAPEDDATTDDKHKKKDKKAKKSKKSADAPAPEDDDTTDIKQAKKDKKSKKRKAADAELAEPAVEDEPLEQDFIKFDDTSADRSELPILTNGTISRTDSKKSKKNDKKDKKARKAEESKADDEPVPEINGDAEAMPEEQPAEGAEDATPGKKEHFAVFVGNLPFTATKEEILQHFEKIHPKEVRIMTHKETGKPKGFAFVEFTRFDHMQTCLKKYHHSVFGEGKKGRKINVELSAGGGGNTEARRTKIQTKNEKLDNERQRDYEKRDELEAKKEERKAKKDARQKKDKKGAGDAEADSSGKAEVDNGGIHPSRLAMLAGPPGQDSSGPPNKRRRF